MANSQDVFREIVDTEVSRHPTRHAVHHREFALERPREGAKALHYLQRRYSDFFAGRVRVLDTGGGNGGFLLPFAELSTSECIWIDRKNPAELTELIRRTGARIRRVLADASALPLGSNTIDIMEFASSRS